MTDVFDADCNVSTVRRWVDGGLTGARTGAV